ncbi:MAG: hypothetical protein GY842_20850, partial [bacterium]|nr:hypothetical protein [bacterium]
MSSVAVADSCETVTRSHSGVGDGLGKLRVAGLTILCHPDAERVGEHAALPGLLTGQAADLSRHRPLFAPIRGGHPRPLLESHLSREPIRLVPGAGGSVVLEARTTRTTLKVNGEEVPGSGRGGTARGSGRGGTARGSGRGGTARGSR